MTERLPRSIEPPSIAEAVLATGAAPTRRRTIALALLIGLGSHAGAWFAATQLGARTVEPPPAKPEIEVALEPPPPRVPDAPPPEPPPPSAAATPRPTVKARRASTPHEASPPAQAAQIVARAIDPSAPLDFSGDTFVTGNASAYAGGVTAANGPSTRAVDHVDVAPSPPTAAVATVPLSRPVELDGDEWQCPWPHEAELAEIDQQTVTLRVHVDADGRARSVRLLSDPGSGFGAAARACALLTRFSPALDRAGKPISADSPPIRVRFTR